MGLSTMISPGPPLPSGCFNIKVKTTGTDPNGSTNQVDVTTLSDTDRVYADAPLKESTGSTTVTASFYGSAPAVDPMSVKTGWICIESETEAAVGEYQKGTATWVYVAP